jgi:trans-aconitate methyltransferase
MIDHQNTPGSFSTTQLNPSHFEEAFGEELSAYVRKKIMEYEFSYAPVTKSEYDYCLQLIMKALLSPNLIRAGAHRLEQWEKGWTQNLENYIKDPKSNAIIPHYFEKYGFVRWKQEFIKPVSKHFEYFMCSVIQDWLFDQYLRDAGSIYEFGCGTGHNLFRARQVNPLATLWGLDWTEASQHLIQNLRKRGVEKQIFAHRFDYFNPDLSFKLEPDSAVYTVASLEQIGDGHGPFINYLMQNKPKICIHIEPIGEVLNEAHLLDYLSMEYFKKRNYLSGFLTRLRELEAAGEAEILRAQRTYIGSLFIEGYSVVVWRPRKPN